MRYVVTLIPSAQLYLLVLGLISLESAAGQIVQDTTFSWRGYSRISEAQISIYESTDERRPYAIVVLESATNAGMSTTEDGRYLAEQIGREFGIDPTLVLWFFRWGAYSFPEAKPVGKELILRATFKRSKSGSLGSPLWRVVSREAIEEATDRQATGLR